MAVEEFEGGAVGDVLTTSNTVLSTSDFAKFVADGRTGQGAAFDAVSGAGVGLGVLRLETIPGGNEGPVTPAGASVDWRRTSALDSHAESVTTSNVLLLNLRLPGDPSQQYVPVTKVDFFSEVQVGSVNPADARFFVKDFTSGFEELVALPANQDQWFHVELVFAAGAVTVAIALEDGTAWHTSPAFPQDSAYVLQAADSSVAVLQSGVGGERHHSRIDNLTLTVIPVATFRPTRLYPRDDGLGMSSAPRIYPRPKAHRIIGGYR